MDLTTSGHVRTTSLPPISVVCFALTYSTVPISRSFIWDLNVWYGTKLGIAMPLLPATQIPSLFSFTCYWVWVNDVKGGLNIFLRILYCSNQGLDQILLQTADNTQLPLENSHLEIFLLLFGSQCSIKTRNWWAWIFILPTMHLMGTSHRLFTSLSFVPTIQRCSRRLSFFRSRLRVLMK